MQDWKTIAIVAAVVVAPIMWAKWRLRHKLIRMSVDNDMNGIRKVRRWRSAVQVLASAVMIGICIGHDAHIAFTALFCSIALVALLELLNPDILINSSTIAKWYKVHCGAGGKSTTNQTRRE